MQNCRKITILVEVASIDKDGNAIVRLSSIAELEKATEQTTDF